MLFQVVVKKVIKKINACSQIIKKPTGYYFKCTSKNVLKYKKM